MTGLDNETFCGIWSRFLLRFGSRILRDEIAKKLDMVGLFGDGSPITPVLLVLLCGRAPNSGRSLSCYQREQGTERIM